MNKFIFSVLSIIVIFFTLINSAKSIPDKQLHFITCNVGQGDGIIIITPLRKIILIDAGPDNSIQDCLSSHTAFFQKEIYAIFITHFHADHLVGFIDLFNFYRVKNIIKNELNYSTPEKEEFEKRSSSVSSVSSLWQGDTITIEEDLKIHTLWPAKTAWNTINGNWQAYLTDFNDSSLVLLLTFKNTAFLLTGDSGTTVLDKLASQQEFLSLIKNTSLIKVYKVPHHGSKDAISNNLLNVFHPDLAVISSGKNNTFGHPHRETLTLFSRLNIPVYRTDQQGTVELITDGYSLKLVTNH